MKVIYLAPRYLEALVAFNNADLTQAIPREKVFEFFNERDLSVILRDTQRFLVKVGNPFNVLFETHDEFSNILLNHNAKSEISFDGIESFSYSALSDQSILAFNNHSSDDLSLVKAIEKGRNTDDVIGTPIWNYMLYNC